MTKMKEQLEVLEEEIARKASENGNAFLSLPCTDLN